MKEADLQQQISDNITEFYSLIRNREQFLTPVSDKYDYQPYFSMNYLIRQRYVRYARRILKVLDSDLEMINGEKIGNISLEKTQRLYPDILLYNYNSSTYIIMELKNARSTGREAATELLGYYLELQNHLPLSGHGDVVLIIVATEYSDLLLHSVATMLLEDIPVLCLKPVLQEEKLTGYDIVNVDAWTNMDRPLLQKEMFYGCTLCLYGKDEEPVEEAEVLSDLLLGSEYLREEANRMRSTGFCIVWKNFLADGVRSPVAAGYFITFFMVNPYKIYQENFYGMGREDTLSRQIEENIRELGAECYQFGETAGEMKEFLEQKYSPMYEGYCTCPEFMEMLEENGKALYCDSWGCLGEFIRELYKNPAVGRMIDRSRGDFHAPECFFRLLDYTCREYLFAEGMEYSGDYLLLGSELGALNCLLVNLKGREHNPVLESRIRLLMYRIANGLLELGEFYGLTKSLRIDMQEIEASIQSTEDFIAELVEQLKTYSPEYFGFIVGLEYYYFFNGHITFEQVPEGSEEQLAADIFPVFVEGVLELLHGEEGAHSELSGLGASVAKMIAVRDWSTMEELSAKLKELPEKELRQRLLQLDVKKKKELLQAQLYTVLSFQRTVSMLEAGWMEADKLSGQDEKTAELLKLSDTAWLISQVENANKDTSDGVTYIYIDASDTIQLERSDSRAVRLLYAQLKKDEILIKTNICGVQCVQKIKKRFL